MLVMIKNDFTDNVANTDDAFLEAPFGPGASGTLLAFHRIGIDVVAAEAVLRGDQIGTDALRREIGLVGHGRVHRPGTAIGAHRHTTHRFDATADGEHRFTRDNLRSRHVAGLEARGAEAVDLHAGGGFGVIGVEHGYAGDVAALLADRGDTAEDHIVNVTGVDAGAIAHRLQHLGAELNRGDFVQLAVLAALAARGADGVVDIGFGHGQSPKEVRSSDRWLVQNAATGSAISASDPASSLARNARASGKYRAAK